MFCLCSQNKHIGRLKYVIYNEFLLWWCIDLLWMGGDFYAWILLLVVISRNISALDKKLGILDSRGKWKKTKKK